MTTPKTTFFGHKAVEWMEKSRLVADVFNTVAPRYDVMNDVMSFGVHRLWKDIFDSHVPVVPNAKIIDMAGGTGDIARRIHARYHGVPVDIQLMDINHSMIREGINRSIDQGTVPPYTPLCGDGSNIPCKDGTFDVYTIAFGLRNITDIPKALAEAYRVLKPGGQFLCLEFSHPQSDLMQTAYSLYSRHIIPKIGRLLTGSEESYQYLVDSIERFPTADGLSSLIQEAGFHTVNVRTLTNGIVAIHHGWR